MSRSSFVFMDDMATSKMRQVDTRFWTDTWVRRLNALDRYAFLYFLTCPHSTWCGVYEVDLSMVAFETGIDEHDLTKSILPRLSPKVVYIDGWVCIKNFEKYHSNSSEKTRKGIENAWMQVPEEIRLKIKDITGEEIPLARGMEGVSPSSSSLSSSSSSNKNTYGEFENVFLSDDEYNKLTDAVGEEATLSLIAELSSYIAASGKNYRSHYAALQNWVRRRIKEHKQLLAKPKGKGIIV